MKKNNFKGCGKVYGFTFRQATKGIGFRAVTLLVSLLIIGVIILVNIINAKPDKEESAENQADAISQIEAVYVLDESGLAPTDYHSMLAGMDSPAFRTVDFITMSGKSVSDTMKEAVDSPAQAIVVAITSKDSGFQIEAMIPESKTVTESEANELLSVMMYCFETNKLVQAGLTNEQLMGVMTPSVTTFSTVGEDTSETTYLIKVLAPMVFGLLLYFMLLLHSQTISKEVSTEKTSKLMETLLITVHPYALIAGKVLAISSMAIMQFLIWIASVFVGLYGGNAIAHSIYPGYENSVISLINFLRDNIGESAFTLPALILAIIIFCFGFIFYCVIAGLAGCMVIRPEDAASTVGIFQFPIVISWLVSYLAPMMENEALVKIARYIPFTSPFCVPVELITGTVNLGQGVIVAVILIIFSIVIISVSARIYKGLVLYNGDKVNLKTIGKVLKAEQ